MALKPSYDDGNVRVRWSIKLAELGWREPHVAHANPIRQALWTSGLGHCRHRRMASGPWPDPRIRPARSHRHRFFRHRKSGRGSLPYLDPFLRDKGPAISL